MRTVALNVFTIYIKQRLTEIQFCNANTPPKWGCKWVAWGHINAGTVQHDTPSMIECFFWMLWRGVEGPRTRPWTQQRPCKR
ncbi:hypothetical protein CBM2634_B60266 [Cupriavidus taiwanensis]|uniref:Uncharacterized protein n=1 Tax=Cupriavidus taiwanensis TaxID=164546 RepID=A0A375JCK5_9BURK|nr:hypothetical protein CBM2634_B60266 [Cupriavidus taiwanensis]